MNRDPIGYRGGMNLYGYVLGRPTYYVDPTGLVWHHDLPWQFIDEFDEIGIDINDPQFGWDLDWDDHTQLHRDGWNEEWREFFETYEEEEKRVTKKAVYEKLYEMRTDERFEKTRCKGKRVKIRYKHEYSRRGWKKVVTTVKKTKTRRIMKLIGGALPFAAPGIAQANAAMGGCDDEIAALDTALRRFANKQTGSNCQDVADALKAAAECGGAPDEVTGLIWHQWYTRSCSQLGE